MKVVDRIVYASTSSSNIIYLLLLFFILCINIEALPTIYRIRTEDRLHRAQRAKELAPPSFMKRSNPYTNIENNYVYLMKIPTTKEPLNESPPSPYANELYDVLRNF